MKGEEGSNAAHPNSLVLRVLEQEFNLLSRLRSLKSLSLLHRGQEASLEVADMSLNPLGLRV